MTVMDIKHAGVRAWVGEIAALCNPDSIYICSGSADEHDQFTERLVKSGVFKALAKKRGSFAVLSDPNDVARVEDRTFICTQDRDEAGPTNNWRDPEEMRAELRGYYRNCMKGRTMYVVPFAMGVLGSKTTRIALEITDSEYVVINMRIMTRMGRKVLDALGNQGEFVPCVHSVGRPLASGEKDVAWPCNPDHKYIVHFPETREIWSYGSGYGGNALLGKKCFALRIASYMAWKEGWLAEHMLILGITNPKGQKRYIAAAFPSACGKTNLAMLVPTLPGWKVECVGDDIAWMHYGDDGRLYASNPEYGFFGVAPGTNMKTNPNAMRTLESNSVFTNCALTPDGDVWWEGIGHDAPEGTIAWTGEIYDKASGKPGAHPNSRFTAPAPQCPVIDQGWESPEGVPLDALLFGGRRAGVVPLVHEAFSWNHGVFMGSIVSSEQTAAAAGKLGVLRRDPFAMLPFCGYNMADYFAHWIDMGTKVGAKLPRIFYVNWFRKGADGKFLWPGYGENSRVLAWIYNRCSGEGLARETAIGFVPEAGALDASGLGLAPEAISELTAVDKEAWKLELAGIRTHYESLGDHMPQVLYHELSALENRLG